MYIALFISMAFLNAFAQFHPFLLMGFLRTTIFALLLFQAMITIHAQRDDCPSQLCGQNSFAVRFPFRLQGQQLQSCGYPGFDLSCVSHNRLMAVVIHLPNSGDFYVRDINYLSQEIQLYDPNNCLSRRLLSLNLSNTPFTAGYFEDYTFLSCPPHVSLASTRFTKIDCLSNSTVSVVATLPTNLVQPSLDACSVITTLPMPFSWSHDDDLNDQDIRLTWGAPNCESCEAKGGVCGFENITSDQILCFADRGTDNSQGIKIFKIIALSLVIPAVACCFCITCFACMIGRRAARQLATIAPPPSPPPTTGLDELTIESYTKVVLGESRRLPGPNGATCPICLVDYHPKDTIRCIPQCDHCFHSDCIDEWLRLNGSCPVCRNSPSPALELANS